MLPWARPARSGVTISGRKLRRIHPPAPGRVGEMDRHLLNVTATFVDMLQHRQTADYDGAKAWSRIEVLERLAAVKEAFASWSAVRGDSAAQTFLVTLLLKERKP